MFPQGKLYPGYATKRGKEYIDDEQQKINERVSLIKFALNKKVLEIWWLSGIDKEI